MIGVDPGPFTLRELVMMADGHAKAAWNHTSHILAALANIFRSGEVVQPYQMNPLAPPPPPPPKINVRDAKAQLLALGMLREKPRLRRGPD